MQLILRDFLYRAQEQIDNLTLLLTMKDFFRNVPIYILDGRLDIFVSNTFYLVFLLKHMANS